MADFIAVKKLKLGAILGQTFTLLAGRPQFFFGLALLEISSVLIWLLWIMRVTPVFGKGVAEITFFLSLALVMWNLACQGAFAVSVIMSMRGDGAPGLGAALARGLRNLPSLLLSVFLLCLSLVVIYGLAAGMFYFGVATWKIGREVYEVLIYYLVFFAVATMLFCYRYGLFVPSCVTEGWSGTDSLRRSRALTRGHCLKIFGLMILLGLGLVVWFGLTEVLIGLFPGSVAVMMVALILSCPLLAFYSVVLVVTFHDLQALHKGPDLTSLAWGFRYPE